MSKLRHANSKLSGLKKNSSNNKQTTQKPVGVVSSKKTGSFPKSFRLNGDDNANLSKITKAVNEISRSKISETKIIQALLSMGAEFPPERVLKALRALL